MKKRDTPTRVHEGQRNTNIDIHELLKQEMYNEKITPQSTNSANSGNNKAEWTQQNRPYSAQTFGISDQYVMLDSFLKSENSNMQKGEIFWNLYTQGSTTANPNVIGVIDTINTVISILIEPFSMPILEENTYPLSNTQLITNLTSAGITLIQNNDRTITQAPVPTLLPPVPLLPTLSPYIYTNLAPVSNPLQYIPLTLRTPPWMNDPLSQVPFGNAMTIYMQETGLQSYSDLNGQRHNFNFKLKYPTMSDGTNPNMLDAQPLCNYSNIYYFTEPLIALNTVSLIFRNPDIAICFEPDIILCKLSINFVYTPTTTDNILSFTFTNHKLLTGDRIYVRDFNSGIYPLDSYINNPAGLLVGYMPAVTPVPVSGTQFPTDSNIFYTDPLIRFTIPLPSGTVTSSITSITSTSAVVAVTITYIFGSTIFNLTVNYGSTTTATGTFNIGIFSGTYIIEFDTTANITYIISPVLTLVAMSSSNNVYIAKRRLRIPIKFRCIVNKVTNYITPW